jgi:hypothetical protein
MGMPAGVASAVTIAVATTAVTTVTTVTIIAIIPTAASIPRQRAGFG